MDRLFKVTDRILGLLVLAVLAVVAYIVINREAFLVSRTAVLLLVAVPLALAVAMVGTYLLAPQVRANLVLALTFGLVALYLSEVFLYFDPLHLVSPAVPGSFDQRTRLEVVLELRAQGEDAHLTHSSAQLAEDPLTVDGMPLVPLGGVPDVTTVLCNETGSHVVYQADRYGFRNPDELWDGAIDVALVGDSFVQGWCVPDGSSFTDVIRARLPATAALSHSGHGPLAQLGIIREYVPAYRPRHVVWFFFEGNDLIEDLPREMGSPILRRYLEPGFSQRLEPRRRELGEAYRAAMDDRLVEAESRLPRGPRALGIVRLLSLRNAVGVGVRVAPETGPDVTPATVEQLRPVLAEAQRAVEQWGGTLTFVYLPGYQVAVGDTEPAHHPAVLRLAEELGLPTIDLLPDFRDHPEPTSLFPYEQGAHLVPVLGGLHYGIDGHRLVAERVLDALP